MKKILILLLLTAFACVQVRAQDLPSPAANLQTLTSGSYVIAMDNTLQTNSGADFNLKAYGLVVYLLNNDVKLKWVIKAGKTKDGIDFMGTAEQFKPTLVSGGVSRNFKAGPFVIQSADTAGVAALIDAFCTANNLTGNNRPRVYRLTAAANNVDIRYDMSGFKPKAAILDDGKNSGIHVAYMTNCAIPTSSYSLSSGVNLVTGCFTFASEPHNDASDNTTISGIKSFVQLGGNFLAECKAIETYENSSVGHFQTNNGITVTNTNITPASTIYPNADLSFSQFEGNFDINSSGSVTNWKLASGSSFINNEHNHATGGIVVTQTPIGASVSKLISSGLKGGLVFYLGNHNFSSVTTLTSINGIRMYMNAFLTPVSISTACQITQTLGNTVWLDANNNGVLDGTESGISNIRVRLYKDADGDNIPDSAPIDSTLTNSNGAYSFTQIQSGKYIVGIVIPGGYSTTINTLTSGNPDNDTDYDNNGVNTSGNELRSNFITLSANGEPTTDGDGNNGNQTLDFGLVFSATPGQRCFASPTTPNIVNAKSTWTYDAINQTVTIRITASKTFVDNTYGNTAIGWPSGHTFANLTGSDKLGWSIKDANGVEKLNFIQDYISSGASTPSGYGTLGFGGDGAAPTVGNASDVVKFKTSLDQNFNDYGYALTTNSPATDANYTPNATYPNWIYDVWYEVTIKLSAFGSAGFGYPDIASVHASPSKTGNNTEIINPRECPGPLNLGNTVWLDTNNNGVLDGGESGTSGIRVRLYKDSDGNNIPDGAAIDSTLTNASGIYSFTQLQAGNYIVGIVIPGGYSATTTVATSNNPNNEVDNDNNGVNTIGSELRSNFITLSVNGEPTTDGDGNNGNLTLDFGLIFTATPGQRCFASPTNPNIVNAKSTWTYDAVNQTVTIRITPARTFVDNTYGNTAIGWPNGHTFANLTGSDKLGWSLKDANGVEKLNFIQDYISASSSFPSGYGTLGFGGDGSAPTVGNASDVVKFNSSLDQNFNGYGYVLTTNSPATNASYTPNATYPNWIYDVWYEVTIKLSAFGSAGFGYPDIATIHASPSKTGNNTEIINPVDCSDPLNLGNLVWEDLNNNGIRNAGEPGISAATVRLYLDANNDNIPDGAAIATTTTDANGIYGFSNLSAGNYIVGVVIPSGYSLVATNGGDGDNNIDNDNNGLSTVSGEARSNAITLSGAGEPDSGVDGDGTYGNLTLDFAIRNEQSNCTLLIHNNYADFNASSNPGTATTLWFNLHTKLTNFQLTNNGDYVLFSGGTLTFNGIGTSFGSTTSLPNGKIIADNTVSVPTTTFDIPTNTWITRVPLAYSSSDIFISGAAITSSTGYTLSGGSKSTALSGNFYSNKSFSSSWFYGVACYQPTFINGTTGSVNSVSGTPVAGRQTGTPNDQTAGLVAGGSGGGGSNFTGSYSSGDNFSACPPLLTGAIGDFVWNDYNSNGIQDAGEPGIPGVEVKLYIDANHDCIADGAAIATTTTDANGLYLFSGLPAGNYMVVFPTSLPGHPPSLSNAGNDDSKDSDPDANGKVCNIDLSPGETDLTIDAGFDPSLNLGNLVWEDLNNNGVRDAGEPGVSGATVHLYLDANNDNIPDGAAVATTTTDVNGIYGFTNLTPGNYIVGVVIPTGYTLVSTNGGDGDNNIDNDNNGLTTVSGEARSNAITLSGAGEPDAGIDGDDSNGNLTLDFAINKLGSIGDFVWSDSNGNGIQDAGEPGIPGVEVKLYIDANHDCIADGAAIATTTTDANGLYLFSGLPAGNYLVVFPTSVTGYIPSPNNAGSDDAKDSDPDANGKVCNIDLSPGETDLTIDAGFTPLLNLGNLVWEDLNNNGVRNAGEPGISGATVHLYLDANNDNIPDGPAIATTTTDANGLYGFNNLLPGNYIVGVEIPACYSMVATNGGDPDNNIDNDNNGLTNVSGEARSNAVTLSGGAEPSSGVDGDGSNGNLTIDFAIIHVSQPHITCPDPLTVQCASEVPAPDPNSVDAGSNCGGNVIVTNGGDEISNQSCPNHYTITRTYIATDAFGNSATCHQTITVNDNIKPTILLTNPGILPCNPTENQIKSAFGSATVTDNCSDGLIANGVVGEESGGPCMFSRTKTWTVTDNCGNTETASQTVTYRKDIIKPTITLTDPGTLPCNPTDAQINAAFGTASVTDNCSDGLIANGVVGEESGGSCMFSKTKTWTVTDNCGNTETTSQTVTYRKDLIKPTITLTDPGTLPCNPTDAQINAAFGTVSVTDNCSDGLIADGVAGEESGGPCMFSRTKTWTVTDNCGNTQTASQTVSYRKDIIKPTITVTLPTGLPCNPTDAQINAAFGKASVTDNCSDGLIADGIVGQETGGPCMFSKTKTWTVTDNCGNTETASQTITYRKDVIKPTITVTPPSELPCNPTDAQINAAFGTASVTDNCSDGLIADGVVGEESGGPCMFTRTKTWTVTDNCGNTQTASQTVTYRKDLIKPTITLTDPGTLPCNPTDEQINAAFGTASVTDNCSEGLIADGSVGNELGEGCSFSKTKTWTVTDNCGNIHTASQTVTYSKDVIKPSITLTDPGTLPCNPTDAQINAAFGTASVTDNCSDGLIADGIVGQETGGPCMFSKTKTWTVTDNCGNTETASQTVNYRKDIIKPTITVTPPTGLPCNPTDAQINAAFGTASVTDNCSDGLIADGVVGEESGGPCMFSRTKTWTVTDNCGNTQTASQTITYRKDLIKPTISVTPPTELPCNPTDAEINAAFGTASVTDNCSEGLIADGVVGEESGGPCMFSRTKNWTVTDNCGNTQTASQTVTYRKDTIKPTITVTPPSELPCNPTDAQINAAFGTASVTDNCSDGLIADGVVGEESGGPCMFSRTKTWTVTDNCGNTQTASQTITYRKDIIKPTITVTQPTGLPCNPTDAQINSAFGTASVTDNCSEGLIADGSVGNESGEGCSFSKTKTWTVTDNCGNTETASQTVTYRKDVTKPTITVTPPTELPCNPTDAEINAAFGTASVTDNCSEGLIADGVVGEESGGPCMFSRTKTWTVTDNCGNTQTTSQTVTYRKDLIKPTITLTDPGTLPCNPTDAQINSAFGTASVTDNCSDGLIADGVVGEESGGPCMFSRTKTWTVTDNCGNTETTSQTVTYRKDLIKPTITVTPPTGLPCNPTEDQINAAFGTASVTDNCSDGLVADASLSDESGSGCNFSRTKTWTVTDNCGNTQTASQTVTYRKDIIKPTITVTPPSELPCNPTDAEINAAFGAASVTDNCSDGLVADGSVGEESGEGCAFSKTKTWTVTDNCGNTQTASQSVNYRRDVIKPTLTITPSASLPCNPTDDQINAAFGTASVTDNCSDGLVADGSLSDESGSGCNFSKTKTWTVTDNCGNTQTASQTVTYRRDIIKPTITVTPPTELPCNPTDAQINAAFGIASVTDNCSEGLVADGSVGDESGKGCTFSKSKTWTVTDNCGNTQTATQTVTYSKDVIKPTITLTDPGTLPCNPSDAQINAAFGTATVTDNCSVDLSASFGTKETGTDCYFTATRTWTVTDNCGNTQTASQSINFRRDVIKPTITITPSSPLPCNPTDAQINAAFGSASVTDNCSEGFVASGSLSDETGSGCNFSKTKTWTVTDNCGNTQTASQAVTFTRDVIKPTITITPAGPIPCNPTDAQINAAFGTASVTDNCSEGLIADGSVDDESGEGCSFSKTKTWTVTDNCGNTQTASQTVTYSKDIIKPTIKLTDPGTLPCNPTDAEINAAFGTATVTDNCNVDLSASFDTKETGASCDYTTTRTWTVTDNCGNTQTASQSVSFRRDVIKPTITITPAGPLPCNPTDDLIKAAFGSASVTDNCSEGLVADGSVGQESGEGCSFSKTKAWTVTDNCGNTQTASQTITYTRDVFKPTVTITPAGPIPCNPTDARINAAFGTASVTDNCSEGLVADGSVGDESGEGCSFSKTKTWTVTDNCGNTQTASQTVNYTKDVIKPTIKLTDPGTLPCNPTDAQINAAFGTASVTDNCSNDLSASFDTKETGAGCNFTATRTWTVTDNCGNTQTASQSINFRHDVIKPTITITPAGPLQCNPTDDQINAAFGTASVTDNCSEGLVADGSLSDESGSGCNFSKTKTWTVTDNCGNTQTASQTVTYRRDVIKPTITITPAGPIPCNPTDAQINAAFGTASVTDNCSEGLVADGSMGNESGEGCSFSKTKTWTVTDNCGNTQTASQTVTYSKDTIKPTITLTDPGTLPCNPTDAQINAAFGTATVTDNCSVDLSASFDTKETGTGCYFTATRTWTVTDNCGNTQTASQSVNYRHDVTKPTITITSSTPLPCNPTDDQINAAFGTASVTDNCSDGLVADGSLSDESGSGCNFSKTKTWTVTDNCGNTQTASQTVTYRRDIIKPTITVTPPTELPCNPTDAQINAAFGIASVTDNCSEGLVADGSVGDESGEGCSFSKSKTWTVTDNCGNTQTATQTVTYSKDVIKPTITLTDPGTLPCNPTDAQINAAFGTATVTDNCSLDLSASFDTKETGVGCDFTATRTWTVTDNCGNTQTASQSINYRRDVIKPTFTITPSTALPCNPTDDQINAAFGTASVTDNCSDGLVADGSLGDETGSGCNFSKTKTWTVTDNCGNTQTASQIVTYRKDVIKPTITITPAGPIPCNPTDAQINAAFGTASVTDNCSDGLVADGSVGDESGEGCSFSKTKTWTVTDNCGNTETASQTVTYRKDIIKPTITVTPPTGLPCNPTDAEINAAFGTASVTDNCSEGLVADGSVGNESGGGCSFSKTKTWTVTDNCGNTQTASQTVTYRKDVIKPTITVTPPTGLPCNPTEDQINAAFGTASVTDNCSDGLVADASLSDESGSGCNFSKTKTWTVTDNCGNTQTASQTVTYRKDVIKPTITITPAGPIPCNPTDTQINAAFGTASVTDNCIDGLIADGSVGNESGEGCAFSKTKTWTVTDNCGNTQTASQTVTYRKDVIKPTITVTPPSGLPCNPTEAEINAAFGTASVTDNCSDGLVADGVVGQESGEGCLFSRTKTWTVTDNCGNTQTASQTINYRKDLIKPTITITPPTTLPCNPTDDQINAAFGTASVTDNCSEGLVANGEVGKETGEGCTFSNTKTWTVTDNCGNIQTASQTVTYSKDVTKPTITVTAPGSLPCNPTYAQINAAFGSASVTDNCSVGLVASGSVGQEFGEGCSFSKTKTWTVTDNCGNTQAASQTLSYTRDLIKPTIHCPEGGYLGCNPTSIPGAGTATATDNCSTAIVTSSIGDVMVSGCNRTRTTTYTATDACGNTQTCTQVYTWQITTAPQFSNCNQTYDLGVAPQTIPTCNNYANAPFSGGAVTASNECGSVEVFCSAGNITSPSSCTHQLVLTFTATACGFTSTCTRTYNWSDNGSSGTVICNNNTIVIDQNVTINFGTNPPTYSGDPDLQSYFTYDNSGATPDTWKAIFNIGANKLLVKNGATITTTKVNGYAPGIKIIGTCTMEVENNGHVVVSSNNQNAGNLEVQMNGNILVNGEIRNEVTGTLGLPGAITMVSKFGDFNEGQTGLIQILGIDPGANVITLQTCGSSCGSNGDITISGLVKDFAHAHAGDLTQNRPNINVVSLNGAVTINASTAEPLYDEFPNAGGLYDIYGGLLSWVRDNVNPGNIKVQAKKDITVNGHGTDPTGAVRTSFGAIAAIGTASSSPGGTIDVRSLEGKIIGKDRAFDVSGRNRLATNFAHIGLFAKQDIVLSRTGVNNNFNPVVNASAPTTGDFPGINDLRSYSGSILVGTNAILSAALVTGSGASGQNNLTACGSVSNSGTITPNDSNPGDNSNVCSPTGPTPLFTDCISIGGSLGNITRNSRPESEEVIVYPNPTTGMVTVKIEKGFTPGSIIKVMDLAGKTLITDIINPAEGQNMHLLNLGGFARGLYIITVQNAGSIMNAKIIVQ